LIEDKLPGICDADPFVPFPARIAIGNADLMRFQTKQYLSGIIMKPLTFTLV